jgi:phospholipid/cholesterol/gamma-HCH transport system ATP-binding protein
MEAPVIEVENLSKSFGTNHVLKNFSMKVPAGKNLVILGKSGSGKSVLIKCIISLMTPDDGLIKIFGEDVSTYDSDALDKLRAQIGFLFQSNALYDSMTVRDNLEFPLRRHWNKEQRTKRAEQAVLEVLEDVGLAHTIDMMPSELSGGMRKRIALARTLILQPQIILYDEPTTGLDPITGREISHLILHVQKKYNATSIIISHDMNCISITSNSVIMLIDGMRYAQDTFAALQHYDDPKIHEFFLTS